MPTPDARSSQAGHDPLATRGEGECQPSGYVQAGPAGAIERGSVFRSLSNRQIGQRIVQSSLPGLRVWLIVPNTHEEFQRLWKPVLAESHLSTQERGMPVRNK